MLFAQESNLSFTRHPILSPSSRDDKPGTLTERLYLSRWPCPCPGIPSSRLARERAQAAGGITMLTRD